MQKIVYAKFNNCGSPQYKVKLVADMIRGKKALEACDILRFTNKIAARDILKVVNSAIANAVNNDGMDKKELIVSRVMVDCATTYKRGRPAARGRYREILKRNSNITIGLSTGIDSVETVKPVKKVAKVAKVAAKKELKSKTKSISKLTKGQTKK